MSRSTRVKYENSIFINCPFDEDYSPIFNAIVFTVQDLGFAARCARERDDSGENRLEKITGIIAQCKYSIHDLSRADRLSKELPRFNMPFELGLYLGCKKWGAGRHKDKVSLILDKEKYRYLEFITDLRGQDIKNHNNDPKKAMQAVRAWLGPTPERTKVHGAAEIWRRFQLFEAKLPDICKGMNILPAELTFPEYVQLVRRFIITLDKSPP
jgi:hypothetical protein